mmetsp:Transcript_32304/g.69735  ORF Transcript_32304/g.69735 Transcript_32304/m.69735 type:complete len:469 (+) Transcript_32304:202-1608(+)
MVVCRPSFFSLVMTAIPAAMAAVGTSPSTPLSYPNITLESPIMSARVYMPTMKGHTDSASKNFYTGSRFEHASMIGDFTYGGDQQFYGHDLWRIPHDSVWPESGIGLASEFGCGDNGATCAGKGTITNGVLGYESAKAGEPFLKIGVGALVKGSCPDCVGDENGVYRFNSPYEFYRTPTWQVLPSPAYNEITLRSEEVVGEYGYRLQKTVRLDGNIMTVRSILSNLGKKQFTTPWYSHHFFTGNDEPVGPGYQLDLGLSEYALQTLTPQFKQPGLGTWSSDILEYANVTMAPDKSISIRMKKVVPDGVRLKAEFLDENLVTLTDGSFTLHSPNGVSVFEKIPELQTQSRNPFIYAYNVYAERGTLSPEPMLLLYLEPEETTTWTQHLKISVERNPAGSGWFLSMFSEEVWWGKRFHSSSRAALMLLVSCFGMFVASYTRSRGGARRRIDYVSIPDHSKEEDGNVLSVV